MKRTLIRLLVWVPLGFVTILVLSASSRKFAAFLQILPDGWYSFIERTWPSVEINWSAWALAGICAVIIIALAHFLGRKLLTAIRGAETPWPFRRTVVLFLAFCWLFIVVMASSGLFRTLRWFAATKEPLFVQRPDAWRAVDLGAGQAMSIYTSPSSAAEVRNKLTKAFALFEFPGEPPLWETCQFVVSERADGSADKIIIFPRDQTSFTKTGGFVVGDDGKPWPVAAPALRKLIREPH